jgi:hypothetical protein
MMNLGTHSLIHQDGSAYTQKQAARFGLGSHTIGPMRITYDFCIKELHDSDAVKVWLE